MMEKSAEYTVVPTDDTSLPPYEEAPKKTGGRKWKHGLLIGGAIALFTLFNVSTLFDSEPFMDEDSLSIPMPCGLSHVEDYSELNVFMNDLRDSFESLPPPPGHCKPRKHHHKHHHKHPNSNDITAFMNGPPPPPFCNTEELESASTVFKFSTDDFQKASLVVGDHFSDGGQIYLSKNSNLKDEVKVNVTIFYGKDELRDQVDLSAFDNEGKYSVEVKRKPSCPEKRKQENCLVYHVDIEFPSTLESFEELDFHVSSARHIGNAKGLKDIEFGSVKGGLGWGAIYFNGLKAKEIKLGVLYGVVMGDYKPLEKFTAGSMRGVTKVNVLPVNDNVNITASSAFGQTSVTIPADKYAGQFTLYNFLSESPNVSAPHPEDIHITKYRPNLKKGYYKKDNSESNIVLSTKKGPVELIFE
ncbi:hypothetical protein BDB01DRAFT_766836 [Pilobolus umbonatus]|nr:hypothetical protein BDB01DRAFT_766836 [Pilobolus umbonatus]